MLLVTLMSLAAVKCATDRDVRIIRWGGPGGALAFALDGATEMAAIAVAPSVDEAAVVLDTLVVVQIILHLWLNPSGGMYAFAVGVICLRRS